jgi:CHASE3 domain sensor protein
MNEQQLREILLTERELCDAKLEGLQHVIEEAQRGRDKAVELLVSSQGQRLNAYIAILVAVELALRLWGK